MWTVEHEGDEEEAVDDLAHLSGDVRREADEAEDLGKKDHDRGTKECAFVVRKTTDNNDRKDKY